MLLSTVAEALLVERLERAAQRPRVSGVRDLKRRSTLRVADAELDAPLDIIAARKADSLRLRLRVELAECSVGRGRIRKHRRCASKIALGVPGSRRDTDPIRRQDPAEGRKHGTTNAEPRGDRAGVLPPGTPEDHERVSAWIVSATHGDPPDGGGHGFVGDLDETGRERISTEGAFELRVELVERRADTLR